MAATILSSLTKSTNRDASSLDIAFPFPLFPFPSVPPSSPSFPPPPPPPNGREGLHRPSRRGGFHRSSRLPTTDSVAMIRSISSILHTSYRDTLGPRCRPSPSTTPSSAVDPAIVVAHVVVRRRQRHHCLPSTPTSSSPTLSPPTSSLPMSLPTSLFAADAAAVRSHDRRFRRYRCCFLVDCCMWNPPHPLHRSSRRSMMSSYQRGRQRRTTPTPADPMRGGHRVIVVLPHRRPSPLASTACSLCRHSRRCHPHSPRRRQNDRRRWRRSTTAGRLGDHIVVADRGRMRVGGPVGLSPPPFFIFAGNSKFRRAKKERKKRPTTD
jgi:hypothetical protein